MVRSATSMYLAAPQEEQSRVRRLAEQLATAGLVVHARWLEQESLAAGSHDEAVMDLTDIALGEVFVLYKPFRLHRQKTTGGHHVETGIAMTLGKPCVLVGQPENVFHHHRRWTVVHESVAPSLMVEVIEAAASAGGLQCVPHTVVHGILAKGRV